MNVIHLYAALVLCLLFNRIQADHSIKVSHQKAIGRCQGSGGLAPSNYFYPVPGTVSYPPKHTDLGLKHDELSDLNLKDGESAWVAGFASYSLPIVFNDCVVWTENTTRQVNGSSIYSCLNSCRYNTSTTDGFVGVNSRYCVCLTRDVVNANRVRCDPANDTLLDVFGVKTEMVKDKFLYQCNNMQMSTAKCTEKHNSVCHTANKEECTNNNNQYLENGHYCVVTETKTWMDSVNYCKNISGDILTVLPQLVSEVNARVNDTVGSWVGTFRSFTVADDRMGNRPCLVVTRVNNKLVLEPEDCKKERKYVCKNNVIQVHRDSNTLIIGIVIAIVLILALFGILLYFVSIRKICNKTQTSVIMDSEKESQELNPVDDGQHYAEIRCSYAPTFDGKIRSQSCDGNDITKLGKVDCADGRYPIRHQNLRPKFTTDLYSNSQTVHDHDSDAYDTCPSASRFRKTGAALNSYDKLDMSDYHNRL